MALASPDTEVMLFLADDVKVRTGPVRRNLFGPVDHQQLQQDFQRLLCATVEAASRRWSFDFQRDRPATGGCMEWEELRCQDVPAFYHSCVVKGSARPGGAERRRRQLTITDFFVVKKRRCLHHKPPASQQ